MPSGCSGYGTGCNTPSRANSKHSSAARKQEEGTNTMSMFSRVGLGPFALIVLVVVLRHETWCSIVEILELGGVRAVERRVARERHQELLARRDVAGRKKRHALTERSPP